MIAPYVLFLASVVALGLAVLLPGLNDFVMLAGPMLLASLWLLLRALARRRISPTQWQGAEAQTSTSGKRPHIGVFSWKKPKWIVVDGSNVMHWKDGTPQIETVHQVVAKLTALGFSPGVVFDANAGYKLMGSYKHDFALGKQLGLPQDRVMVVAKGTPADPTILAAARDLGARVVTNDRYRDWAEAHPEVAVPGHLIKGGYRDGQLLLDIT